MAKLFGVTLFVSATLLFLVQPMVGKMILPLLGGTPAVWNTCMVFFQALLLAGYYYAHKSSTRLPTRKQVTMHMAVLLAAAGILALGAALTSNNSPVPIVKSLAPQGSGMPFFGVIGLLAVAIGLPFFTVSTTAPLLQKWFSETGHPSAKDPYFLYAASNFGSLLALVAYPFVVEPNLRLVEQAWVWAIGFGVMIVLIMACGNAVKNAPPAKTVTEPVVVPPKRTANADPKPSGKDALLKQVNAELAEWEDRIKWTLVLGPIGSPLHWVLTRLHEVPAERWQRIRWLFLAAVPSALMLALTTKVSTDIVSMPLLWIIPLSLYLITFIIVFAKSTPPQVHLLVTLMMPVAVLLLVFLHVSENVSGTLLRIPVKGQLALEIGTFFLVALACHGELARTRPEPKYLTQFYLTMSIGGMVGGLLNALVAPIVFTFISEYPISLIGACFLLPPLSKLLNPNLPGEPRRLSIWDLILPLLFFAATRYLSAWYPDVLDLSRWLIDKINLDVPARTIATILALGIPTLCCYFMVERPLRFGACVAALWIGTYFTFVVNDRKESGADRTIYTRSYFGTLKLEKEVQYKDQDEEKTAFRRLIHGTTVHGVQHLDRSVIVDGQVRRIDYENAITQALWLAGANGPMDALGLAYISEPHFEFPGREPLSYYHRSGPVGLMFEVVRNRETEGKRTDVACIGLGTGSLSAYGRPGQNMTFFEIDSKVRHLVESPEYFTYIDRAKKQGTNIEFLMGDARLTLEQTDRKWGLMLVDAFSSDAIPAHLLTKEAVELYFSRLTDDGILALHISNRYLDLEPVVEKIADKLQVSALVMHDYVREEIGQRDMSGKLSATWIVVARKPEVLAAFAADKQRRWGRLRSEQKVGLWTDDYTPIKSVLINEANLFGGK
ncbi:MAG TPA: fused MFS/spermidine synthase [Gemmataceae bacterium]|nr:fused MFS/spermidine synthase [Gemmataceae bacterium]